MTLCRGTRILGIPKTDFSLLGPNAFDMVFVGLSFHYTMAAARPNERVDKRLNKTLETKLTNYTL